MSDVVAFLNARLDEDESDAQFAIQLQDHYPDDEFDVDYKWAMMTTDHGPRPTKGATYVDGAPSPQRVLREVEAKRTILNLFDTYRPTSQPLQDVLLELAAVYSNHPDYRQEWEI